MRNSSLYFATRSDRAGAPVLICPQFVATARSRDRRVLGLARSVRDDTTPPGAPRERHRVEGFGQGADLIDLDQHGVCRFLTYAAPDELDVRHEDVVADELQAVTDRGVERLPARPVVLSHRVFERDDRVIRNDRLPVARELLRRQRPPFGFELVAPVAEELRRRRVERDRDLLAGLAAGAFDGGEQHLQGRGVRLEIRREAPLVADAARKTALVEDTFQRVVRLCAPAQRLFEGDRTVRHDHELLEVDVVVGVHAAVQHVHHRHRQLVPVDAAQVAKERQPGVVGRRLRDGERGRDDHVRAEARLGRRAVEVAEREIDFALVGCVLSDDGPGDLPPHVVDRLPNALSLIAAATVAQLGRLVLTGRRSRRGDRATGRTRLEQAGHLDGRVAT